jgi:hypothetical protein
MSKLLQLFFYYQTLIKIFHWQTKNYAQHVASDQLYTALLPLIDQWVEVYQGKYPTLTFEKDNSLSVPLRNMDLDDFKLHLQQFKSFLMDKLPTYINHGKMQNTDLLNIRDEMLTITNKTLYLLQLE